VSPCVAPATSGGCADLVFCRARPVRYGHVSTVVIRCHWAVRSLLMAQGSERVPSRNIRRSPQVKALGLNAASRQGHFSELSLARR